MCKNQLSRPDLENNLLFPVLIDTQIIILQEWGSVLWVKASCILPSICQAYNYTGDKEN